LQQQQNILYLFMGMCQPDQNFCIPIFPCFTSPKA